MRFTLLFLSLFCGVTLAAFTCTPYDEFPQEWRVTYVGSETDGLTTTFFYEVWTDCTGQDLSHWNLDIGDCDSKVSSSPSSSCGKDGSITLTTDTFNKWETEDTVCKTLEYSITVEGQCSEGVVTYVVKGATRCNVGTITGPGECIRGPECVSDSDCDDSVDCTVNQCVSGSCVYTPSNSFCDDGHDCTSNVCDAVAGCVISYDDSVCEDGFDCTTNTCTDNGCTTDYDDSVCEDDIECTIDTCTDNGCLMEFNNDSCDDGIECTIDICTTTGCEVFYDDSVCEDGIECTIDTCTASGCAVEFNNASCEDGIECTIDVCTTTGCDVSYDDSVCQDGIECTIDTCTANGCAVEFNHASCEDEIECTIDTCSLEGCQVEFNHASCEDGIECTVDTCSLEGCQVELDHSVCQDDHDCTIDTCTLGGCDREYNHVACDDSVNCSIDECTDNGCEYTADDAFCADENVCSTDWCDLVNDCQYAANSLPCDDGDECYDPDQCGNFECIPGPAVCPGAEVTIYGGQNYPSGTVSVINDGENLYFVFEAAPGVSSQEFHVYVGTTPPTTSAPGQWPYQWTPSYPVEAAQFQVPLSDISAECDGTIHWAFHMVAKYSDEYECPTFVNPKNGKTQTSCPGAQETAVAMGPKKIPGEKKWFATYNSFEVCCCEGFSHVPGHLLPSTVTVWYNDQRYYASAKLEGSVRAVAGTSEDLAQTIADILGVDPMYVRVSVLRGGIMAVIDLDAVDFVGAGSLLYELVNTPESVFEQYGMSDVRFTVNQGDNEGTFYAKPDQPEQEEDNSESSDSSILVPSLFMTVVALFVF